MSFFVVVCGLSRRIILAKSHENLHETHTERVLRDVLTAERFSGWMHTIEMRESVWISVVSHVRGRIAEPVIERMATKPTTTVSSARLGGVHKQSLIRLEDARIS